MKKFFALFTVLALLVTAGSAFAANPTITFSPSSLSVTEGGSNSAIVTIVPSNGGQLGTPTLDGPSWVSLSGSTLTATAGSSVEAGDYKVTVSVTETYTDEDDATGHTAEKTAIGTASITITVNEASTASDINGDGSSYNANVSDSTVSGISNALGEGVTVQKLPADVAITVNNTDVRALDFDDSNTRGVVALPIMTKIPAGTYVIALTLPDNMPTVTVLPMLYPDGASSSPVAVKFFGGTSGTTEITESNVKDLFVRGATINMVFTVGSDGFVSMSSVEGTSVEAADASMTNPVLAVTTEGPISGNPGKPSGGCSAGFSAMVLTVLGAFIARRKK